METQNVENEVLGLKDLVISKPRKVPFDFESSSQSSVSTEDHEVGVGTQSSTDVPKLLPVVSESSLVFVLVDPWSTGDSLWNLLLEGGHKVLVVWEGEVIRSVKNHPNTKAVVHFDNIQETAENLNKLLGPFDTFKAVFPGSETGVPLAEKLSLALSLPTHPPEKALARRNKYLMGEALRKSGVRAVKQIITTSLTIARQFVERELLDEKKFEVIVKPNMGAGSDDVYLCRTMADFESKFELVNGKVNSLGIKNDGVLVQEFLSGIEYVVDSVSIDGNHQIVQLWEYDKREVNDRFNVYHGSFPLANNSALTQILIEYIYSVLDALDFQNGPAHAEIKLTETGPCLVEIGARCHGGGGSWMELAKNCWGTHQLEFLVESFALEQKQFGHFEFPKKLFKNGCMLDMILYESGVVVEIAPKDIFERYPSVQEVVYYNKIGDTVKKTVDCNTQPGHIILMHEDNEQVLRDFEAIHGLFKAKRIFKLE